MIVSDFSIRLPMTKTLSEIFAPPTMAVNGVFLSSGSSTFENACNSLATSRPDTHGIFPDIPTIELWALCAVPKASQTYTSPSFANEDRNDSTSSDVGVILVHFSPFDGAFFAHFDPGQPSSCLQPFPSSSA